MAMNDGLDHTFSEVCWDFCTVHFSVLHDLDFQEGITAVKCNVSKVCETICTNNLFLDNFSKKKNVIMK